jgi:hypothetical protein
VHWTCIRPRQNKANSRADGDGHNARPPASPARLIVRNKANSHGTEGHLGKPRGLKPILRGFVASIRTNKANSPQADRNGRGPARSHIPLPLGQNVRNKANSSGAARGTSVLWKRSYGALDTHKASTKQSQFPRGRRWAQRKTASIPGGTDRAKQSQFARDRRTPRKTAWAEAHPTGLRGEHSCKQSQFPGVWHPPAWADAPCTDETSFFG